MFFSFATVSATACGLGTAGTQAPPPPVDWSSFASASGGGVGANAPPKIPLAERELNTMQKYVEAILTRGATPKNVPIAPALVPLYAPDATLTIPGVADNVKGPDAIAKAYDDLWGPIFPRSTFAPSKVFQSGGMLAFLWDLRGGLYEKDGAHTWMGVGPFNQPTPMGFGGLTILWFNPDGTIRQDHTYFDVQQVLDQLKDPQCLTQGVMGEYEKFVATMSPSETAIADLPAHMADALGRKSEQDLLAFFAPNVVHEGIGCETDDVADIKEAYERWIKVFPDVTKKVDSFGVGNFAITEFTDTGTQQGKFDDIAPSKKQATWHGAEILQVENGKVAHEWVYLNRREIAKQLAPDDKATKP
jgi:predicted ester cyclase